ncbi:hypothetical protein [Hoeflea sp.]|uniref:hypothetical protein n=1 Tax=Hoeflea sp. TaxID=1940281 RepID=UPI003749EF31
MKIYQPEIHDGERISRAAQLLGRLIESQRSDFPSTNNVPADHVVFSQSEAAELAELLKFLSDDKRFWIKMKFVEGMLNFGPENEGYLRETYLSERRLLGKTRALASKQWADYLARLGIASPWSKWGSGATKMPFEHFRRMEEILLRRFRVPNGAISSAMDGLSQLEPEFDRGLFEEGVRAARREFIEDFYRFIEKFTDFLRSNRDGSVFSTAKSISIMIVLVDSSVLFTSRDWSAAGTMSTVAGSTWHIFNSN